MANLLPAQRIKYLLLLLHQTGPTGLTERAISAVAAIPVNQVRAVLDGLAAHKEAVETTNEHGTYWKAHPDWARDHGSKFVEAKVR